MKTCCVKCRKNTEKLNSKIFKTKNGRLIMQSKCTECWFEKSRVVKEQEAKGLLSNLGNKTPLSKIPLLNVLFCCEYKNEWNDKFMPEVHLKQPGFTYSACGPFTRNKERIGKFMQSGNTDFIYRNELDKGCFQHDMAYENQKI